jgi:ribosome maturation factor RimP
MMDASVVERAWVLAEPLAQQEGLEIVDAEFRREGRGLILRVFLDRSGGSSEQIGGGVTLDELARFSRQLGDVLDVHQVIGGSYTLEASSPGVNRRLRVPSHFTRYVGKRLRVRTTQPLDGRRTFLGVLREVAGDGILMGELPGERFIRFAEIAQANHEFDFGRPR